MTILFINPDNIMKITREPTLYTDCPFLQPMSEVTLRIHRELKGVTCKSCGSSRWTRAAISIGAGFTSLVVAQSKKNMDDLTKLRHKISSILGTNYDEISLQYRVKNASETLKF